MKLPPLPKRRKIEGFDYEADEKLTLTGREWLARIKAKLVTPAWRWARDEDGTIAVYWTVHRMFEIYPPQEA